MLCWLSILAHHNTNTAEGGLVGVGDIVRDHWRQFGRNFYTRYDYEEVDAGKAKELVARPNPNPPPAPHPDPRPDPHPK